MADQILVTGGTGTTGSHVVRLLQKHGAATVVGTRTPSAPGHRQFNWSQQSTATAFDGCHAAYVVAPTDRTDHLAVVQPLLERAIVHGTRRFVLLSSSQLELGGPMMGAVHAWLADNAPEWAVLRPSWFMQNFSNEQHAKTIRDDNAIYSATGSGRVGFIDAHDIAAAACALLTAEAPLNDEVVLTGPATLSYDDIARIVSETIGRDVRHHVLDSAALTQKFVNDGLTRDYAATLAALDEAIRSGVEDRTTSGVERITGAKPNSFQSFVGGVSTSWAQE